MERDEIELQVDVLRSVTSRRTTWWLPNPSRLRTGKSYSVPAPDVMLKALHGDLDRAEEKWPASERRVPTPAAMW